MATAVVAGVLDLVIPGSGAVVNIVHDIARLCNDMQDGQASCQNLHQRLERLLNELAALAEKDQLPDPNILLEFQAIVERLHSFLQRYSRQNIIQRLVGQSQLATCIADVNADVENIFRRLQLASLRYDGDWRQQWELDRQQQQRQLEMLLANVDALRRELGSVPEQRATLKLLQTELDSMTEHGEEAQLLEETLLRLTSLTVDADDDEYDQEYEEVEQINTNMAMNTDVILQQARARQREAKMPPAVRTAIQSIWDNQATDTEAIMNYSELGDEGAEALAEALKHNTALQVLSLVNNSIGDIGVQALATALKQNRSLHTVNLRENQMSAVGARALAMSLQQNSSLQHLDMSANPIGDAGAQAFGSFLSVNSALQNLVLTDCSIGDDGVRALAEALGGNTTLQSLSLWQNAFGASGANELAMMLARNRSLQDLTLNSNKLGDAGANALAKALRTNTTLTSLSLLSTEIGDDGAEALAEALRQNVGIHHLDLWGNRIAERGTQALAAALEYNKTLEELGLAENPIGKSGAASLIVMLTNNATLRIVRVPRVHATRMWKKVKKQERGRVAM